MSDGKKGKKCKRHGGQQLDLEEKVELAGGASGFGLEETSGAESQVPGSNSKTEARIYGGCRSNGASQTADNYILRRWMSFDNNSRPPSKAASTRSVDSRATKTSRLDSRIRRASKISSQGASSSRSRVAMPSATVHIVCAIGENLARETCIASIDAGTPVCLQVTKQGNGQTYAETLAYLEMLKPHEILLNEGRKSSPLAKKVFQLFGIETISHYADDKENYQANLESAPCKSSTVIKLISRSYFDQTKGAELLRRVARSETYDATMVEEYILLSSAHAVLHYTQHCLGATFARNCLDLVVNSGGNNRMAIDRSTLLQLELLTNAKTGKTQNSLIGTVDCTKTTVGSRLLRTNLMSPPCRVDTIKARLDLVETFLGDEEFFYSVLEHLRDLPDVDKMLATVALIPRVLPHSRGNSAENCVVTDRMASKGISSLVCIKFTLKALPAFVSVLDDKLSRLHSRDAKAGNSHVSDDNVSTLTDKSSLLVGLGGGPSLTNAPNRHHLLRAISHALKQPALTEILNVVTEIFTESTSYSRNANAKRHQECFALKSADNGMMDVLRRAFLSNVDDIYKKADEYAEVHGFHVSVKYSTARGYFLSVPSEIASTLPQEFILPAKCGNCIHCTTEEVHSLNSRAQENVQDLLLMTYERIREVLDFARLKYDALASLSDAVALLDLCHSFADNVTLSRYPWCRPNISQQSVAETENERPGLLVIRNGRYAIDITGPYIHSREDQGTIPNDTYATEEKHFTVISGINGSGKSMYLKQVAIIVLLAHCGSYVPAEEASIPVSYYNCLKVESQMILNVIYLP